MQYNDGRGCSVGFYDQENRYLFNKDKDGNYADEIIAKNLLEYQGNLYFVERINEDYSLKVRSIQASEF